MKRVVWKNKSNGQLGVTIPKGSGIREGDLISVQKNTIKKIAYSGVVADLFHYGHLQSLLFAKSIADYNIVGVLTDEAVEEYRGKPVSNLKERKAVLEHLGCVDRVMIQHSRDHRENVQKIHEEFPGAEIILVHGDNIKDIAGAEYLQSIGGKLVQHPYYPRLSTYRILQEFQQRTGKVKDITEFTSFIGNKENISAAGQKTIISSKADTLKALQPLLTKSRIEPLISFTISDWKNRKNEILHKMKSFQGKVVVRSSAVNEDNLEQSNAGMFESILNVDAQDSSEVENAVKKVLQSYKEKNAESSFNQVLVQHQTENIRMSGVVFTRTLGKNAPYYVINYDDTTGSTDSVTSGKEHKSIMIAHSATAIPAPMAKLIEAVREIEETIPGIPLDIEFAINQEVVVFQVRPLAANIHKPCPDEKVKEKVNHLKSKYRELAQPRPHLAGEITYLGDMPDWNPAEIIGDSPNHLDYSLYDYLITNSAWHEARTSQLYYNVSPAKLVELFGNKPYVNVRNTFNSFIPAAISPKLREKLVKFAMEKLHRNPHLQDKVEFEVLYTCYDLSFLERSEELRRGGFSDEEIEELHTALLTLTNHLISRSPESIAEDLKSVFSMEEFRKIIARKVQNEEHSPKELINYSKLLLDECRKKGTVQFSRLARLGFIGKIILQSLVQRGLITPELYDSFCHSITTVASKISDDFKKLLRGEMAKGEFIQHYYHLRPGTYDITSPRYGANPNLINAAKLSMTEQQKAAFILAEETGAAITNSLQQAGLPVTAQHFLSFVEQSTQARELSKFEFTKNLSDALELIAGAGEEMGFTRKEIALLDINDIFLINAPLVDVQETTQQWKKLIKEREQQRQINELLVLPSIIFSENDLDVIQHYEAKPNFVTQKAIESKIVHLNELNSNLDEIPSSIVVLENGDPGYDWIFTRNPAGLITKYGGVASHMSIRCAEFGLPAAIGCGEIIFNQIKNAAKVLLDCKANKIILLR